MQRGVYSFDLFRLREAVFEILFASKKVDEVSLNSLRRKCESHLGISSNTLDGQQYKEPLLSMFTDFIFINDISKKWKKKYGFTDIQEQTYTAGETDFITRVFRDYISTYNLEPATIQFQSTRRCQDPIWAKLCKLVPHLSERGVQEIVKSTINSDIKISATSTSSSTLPTADQLEDSQDSIMIPSAIKYSRQTSPFIAENGLNASQDSIAISNCKSSRSIRSKTIRKKSFKMDNPPAHDLTTDLTTIPCIAMKSSFSTLIWLRCIEQRNLKRESQMVWADIDKELLLPYSYSAKRWNAVSKSMPENMGFSRKLKNLIEDFSKNSDGISEASTNVTDKKNDEDDLISDNDSHCELFRDIFPDEEDKDSEKNLKGLNTRIKSKTPLGDMLNSLLRKKSSTQIFEGNESDIGESSSFITFPVLIANDTEQLESYPVKKRNIEYHQNHQHEPNLGLINDPKGSFNSSHTSALSANNLVCTGSTAQHEPKIIVVRTSLEASRPPTFNSITDDPEALKLAKRKRRVMRNERRIRKVSRALKRESKYNLTT